MLLHQLTNALFAFCIGTVEVHPCMPMWHSTEQAEVVHDTRVLNRHITMTAYAITLSTCHLETLPLVLLDLSCDQVA